MISHKTREQYKCLTVGGLLNITPLRRWIFGYWRNTSRVLGVMFSGVMYGVTSSHSFERPEDRTIGSFSVYGGGSIGAASIDEISFRDCFLWDTSNLTGIVDFSGVHKQATSLRFRNLRLDLI